MWVPYPSSEKSSVATKIETLHALREDIFTATALSKAMQCGEKPSEPRPSVEEGSSNLVRGGGETRAGGRPPSVCFLG